MKYQAPYGSPDPNAPYVDRDTPGATSGSKVPAKAVEHVQRELAGFVGLTGQTPSEADLQQVAKGVRSQILNRIVAGGTANALTGALNPVPSGFSAVTYVPLWLIPSLNNTGAAVLNLNGLGDKALVRVDGSPLKKDDLLAGVASLVMYDGAVFRNLAVGGANAPLTAQVQYSTSGTYTFTVPAGVTRIFIQVWGSGGGGGGAGMSANQTAASGGGGGGYIERYVQVVPGQIINIVVAAGGAGGSSAGGNGGNGNTSSAAGFNAGGGSAGTGAVNTIFPGAAGVGGAAVDGDFNLPGRYGALPTSSGPGGGLGGSSFCSSVPAPNENGPGSAGVYPGGGGNGGSRSSAGNSSGGAGAGGLVIISY